MRPSKCFSTLQYSAQACLTRLRNIAGNACLGYPSLNTRIALSHVVVELLTAWTEFVRAYFLSCVLKPRRVRGGRVALSNFAGHTFNDVIGVAMKRHKPHIRPSTSGVWSRRDEPSWHDSHVLLTSCTDLGCSNLSQIRAAFSLPTRVTRDLPTFRNYVAHRNQTTQDAARNLAAHYTIPGHKNPLQILCSSPHRRPTPLIVDWIDDISLLVEFLCE